MSVDGQRVAGKATIPVADMARANLDKIFPHLTPEQVAAIRDGRPVPASPAAAARPGRDADELLARIDELAADLDAAKDAVRERERRLAVLGSAVAGLARGGRSVSAVLVFSDPKRLRRARKAVNQFVAQSYPLKQLVIVNAAGTPVTNVAHPQVLELPWTGADYPTTGELRNHAADAATGDLLFPFWDDDDVYDPDLLTFMVLSSTPGRAVALSTQARVAIDRATAYLHTETAGVPNSVLCPRQADARFAYQTGEEDLLFFAAHWADKCDVVDTAAWPLNMLLMRVFDGANVATAGAFLGRRADDEFRGRLELGGPETAHLRAVFATFGVKITPGV